MEVLGGRSPYEVVLGIRPVLPGALRPGASVAHLTVDAYAENLAKYFRETYQEVQRVQQKVVDRRERDLGGHLSSELSVGDIVLVKRERDPKAAGPARFHKRTYAHPCRVVKKISPGAFQIADATDSGQSLPFDSRQNADRLIKLDLPVLGMRSGQPTTVEILEPDGDTWSRWKIVKLAIDGRVKLQSLEAGAEGRAEWRDLTACRYSWVQ